MTTRYEGRRAIVTGAAGGLGREVAIQLARHGAAIGIVDIDASGTEQTAQLCRAAGAEIEEIVGDFTIEGAPEAAVQRVADELGGLDVLVNNAGYGGIEPFLGMTHRLWQRTLHLNVIALAMACAAAGRVMKTQGRGRIVNITSPASRMALPDYAAYAASKAGVDSITRAAAVALAPYGILVNSLAPGMMDTEMQRSTEADLARVNGRDDLQAFLDERTRRVPLGRRAEIPEIAAAVVWLCLDAPAYMTAERLNMWAVWTGIDVMLRNAPPQSADIAALKARATNLRRHMLSMARGQGQGYIGQGLGVADILAALYFHELRYDPGDLHWPERDRFLLSTGHSTIALWAALAEARIIPFEELSTYGADGSRLEMSTLDTTPGVEMIGGSLGHGLGQAVGQALGLRLSNSAARVFCELSDGEMEEGSTWEAAMAAGHFGLDGLVALIDCNGIQADGPVVINIEPVADKWRAFGWDAVEIDGNDMNAIVGALMLARATNGKPKAIVLRTLPGKGVPRIETSEKSHFFRVDVGQWDSIIADFEKRVGAEA